MLHLGNNIEILKSFKSDSVDSVVTDPPYGLSFMNKHWDYDVPSVELWREVLRVLKPGGHLLSFGGTRTYHRMVVNIEDAGFEIRDQLQWIYGSGFPKSHNLEGEWQGFGTALKPANEPIVLARKPISMTVAKNVEKYGTGALNIDASRIQFQSEADKASAKPQGNMVGVQVYKGQSLSESKTLNFGFKQSNQGRWPANVLFDEEAAKMLDEQQEQVSRFFYCAKASKSERNAGLEGMPKKYAGTYAQDQWSRNNMGNTPDAKRSPIENFHPTVKPIKLMQYLVKLITPPNGTVLDPFMGSGSTGCAAVSLGFNFEGIEIDKEYFEIAMKRIENFIS